MAVEKIGMIKEAIKARGSAVVAFSGGVDSSFLLHRAHKLRQQNVIAITIRTPYIPVREIEEAVEFTREYDIRHKILDLDFPPIIKENPLERCYLCKKILFTSLLSYARENDFKHVIDGTNADDKGDFRPGLKALEEMRIISPLMESGLTKNEIRQLCRDEGLSVWDKPAMACLLTRIPYDTEVSETMLRMIEAAENVIFEKGFPGTRVRVHGDVARIECMPGMIEKIIQPVYREEIISALKKIGFRYISLDLEGYRTGSSNPKRPLYE